MVLTVGCAESAQDRQGKIALLWSADEFVREYSTAEIREHIANGKIVVGMNVMEVHAALRRLPSQLYKWEDPFGTRAKHVYGFSPDSPDRMYLYFRNDILIRWQR